MNYLLCITKKILNISKPKGLSDPSAGVLRALSVFFRQGAREIMVGFLKFPRSPPVQCGAMTVIWVSILPLKEVEAYGSK